MSNIIQLIPQNDEPRADSRDIATHLGVGHRHVFRLIRDNESRFMELGLVCFENTAVKEDGARGDRAQLGRST